MGSLACRTRVVDCSPIPILCPTLTPASVLLLQEVLGSFLKGLSEFQTRDFSIHHFNPFHVMTMLINYQFPGSCSARSLCPGHSQNTSGA